MSREPFDKTSELEDELDVDFSRRRKTAEPSRKVNTLPRRTKRRKKSSFPNEQNLPPSVILLNIIMIVVVLGICLVVFIVMFNKSIGETSDSSDGSSVLILDSSEPVPQSPAESSLISSSSAESSPESSDVSSSIDDADNIVESDPESASKPSASENINNSAEAWIAVFNAKHFEDDLFIGDSIYTGLSLYGFLAPDHVAAAVGYTPYKAMFSPFGRDSEDSAVVYAWKMQPKRIFIMLGSNDMGGRNHDYLVDDYESFLLLLMRDCPDSTVCVVSIPPVTADSSLANRSGITNEDISSVNARLEDMCKKYGAMYFDLNSLLSDDDGYFKKQYAEIDGLHFVRDTYVLMLSELEKFTSE